MDENKKSDNHLTSPAAFVEGGVQDACDDACSICLEAFTESDPSTVTNCKHEYHLQCILEWCQRSSQCPMCWQAISLKDATSQELLKGVEQERSFQSNPPHNATIFHHTLGEFELPHLSLGANDTELHDRIIQHLAAAAAMGRAHNIRREGHRSRSTTQGRPQYMVFSSHPEVAASHPVSGSPVNRRGENEQAPILTAASPSAPLTVTGEEQSQRRTQLPSSQTDQTPAPASGSRSFAANRRGFSFNNMSAASRSASVSQDRAGPSDLHSFSESLKARLNSVSMRYKESITKGTRGWKERLFSRNTSIADLGSEVRREVNAGLASVSRMMERLETRENVRASNSSASNNLNGPSDQSNQETPETRDNNHLNDRNTSLSCATRSGPN